MVIRILIHHLPALSYHSNEVSTGKDVLYTSTEKDLVRKINLRRHWHNVIARFRSSERSLLDSLFIDISPPASKNPYKVKHAVSHTLHLHTESHEILTLRTNSSYVSFKRFEL
ncbi:hypothetical protein CVT25_001156 [Psilocybe cyanescens]|uniref:Uncharacterized protein n=1 Tax=Psilocybe cyanescens TaxID=93625 RepID=A0A409XEH3_PSICY|nr:hypothetical protein CVT25_001156 [Psilocybe cyanescens]